MLYLIIILLLIIITLLILVYKNNHILIKGKIKDGNILILSYERTKKRIRDDKDILNQIIKYDIKLTSKKIEKGNIIIKWEYLKDTIEDNIPNSNMKNMDFKPVYIIFNNKKGILGVENWEEIRETNYEMIEAIKKQTVKDDMSEEHKKAIENTFENMKKMFDTKEKIEMIALKSIQSYFVIFGNKYKLGQKYFGNAKLPNAFDGKKLPSKLYITAQKNDNSNIEVSIRQDINFEGTENLVEKIKENMLKEFGISEDVELDININDFYVAEYNKKTGEVVNVLSQRLTSAENIMSIEETKFRIKDVT